MKIWSVAITNRDGLCCLGAFISEEEAYQSLFEALQSEIYSEFKVDYERIKNSNQLSYEEKFDQSVIYSEMLYDITESIIDIL